MDNLIWRLEQVVGKLEDFTSRWCVDGTWYQSSADGAPPSSREEMTYKSSSRSCVDRAADSIASWNVVYDQLMSGPLLSYLKASQTIGDDVLTQATLVEGIFLAQHQFLMASARQTTSQPLDMEILYRTMAEKLSQAQEFRNEKRGTPYFNHLSTVSESILALGWVNMNAEGSAYIGSMIDAGHFFANRVLVDFKKNPIHGDWVNAWFETLTQLQSYVTEFHPSGVGFDSSKLNEHLSACNTSLNARQHSITAPLEPSLHPSVSAVTPQTVGSDRCYLKKRQSNPETGANHRMEMADILRHVTNGMRDLKHSTTSRADFTKPSILEPHLNSTITDEQQQSNKHFFTKLRHTGLKLTNEPFQMQCPLTVSTAKQPDNNYNATCPIQPGFNSNCSHLPGSDQPTTVHEQFQLASKGNSHADSQWLSSKSPSQLSPSKQTSQFNSSNLTNPSSQMNQSYANSTPSRYNQSASTIPPSQISSSLQPNNRQPPRFNASYPTTPLVSLAPSQFGSYAPAIPLSNSSPACLVSQASQMAQSCHSKSSLVSKAAQVAHSSHGSITPLPPSDSPRTARSTRSEPKDKREKVPRCALNGKKWIVEYYKSVKNLVVDVADFRESVYIFDCRDCVIRINGKTSAITIDNCKKTDVIFDEIISALEIVNCQNIQAQAMVKVCAVSAENSDGCTVFLSHQSLNARIITSKSSAVNILYPNEQGEYREYPVPEQFCSQWNGDHLVTDLSETRRRA